MARRRFFVDEVRLGRAVLTGDEARHLRQVLRAEPGQRYEISDNRDVWLAAVESVRKDEVRFEVLEKVAAEAPPVRLTILLALVKFDRFEWAIEKATELGVERIVPVEAARSEQGLERAALKRLERWRRIARESSQQSRRAHIPEVAEPSSLAEALGLPAAHRYFLDEAGGEPLLRAIPPHPATADDVALLVGPEGGWTEEERARAAAGWTHVTLGPLILRAETAAIAGAAVIANAWLAGGAR